MALAHRPAVAFGAGRAFDTGDLYFFWGMRSLHANQACAPSSVRCTVLLHFGDPHENSVFKGLSQRLHSMRLRRMARD